MEQHRGDHQELLIRNCLKNNLGTAITVGQRAAAPPALWGREAGKEEGRERGRKKRCPRSGPEPGSEGEKRTLCPAMGSARPAPRYLPERPLVPALREPGVPARRQIGAEAPEAAELPALAGGGVPGLQHPGGTRRQPREEQQQQQPFTVRRFLVFLSRILQSDAIRSDRCNPYQGCRVTKSDHSSLDTEGWISLKPKVLSNPRSVFLECSAPRRTG